MASIRFFQSLLHPGDQSKDRLDPSVFRLCLRKAFPNKGCETVQPFSGVFNFFRSHRKLVPCRLPGSLFFIDPADFLCCRDFLYQRIFFIQMLHTRSSFLVQDFSFPELFYWISRIFLRSASTCPGATDNSSIPIWTKVSVRSRSAARSP